MRVLFCTDGSDISYNSIINFSKWAKDFTVDVLCAIDWSFLPDSISVENSAFAMQCANSADSILEYSHKFLEGNNIKIGEKFKMCGSTVDCIMEVAEKSEYDFIILGSHGKKGIQKWLGSVSQEVASIAKNSVYISKNKNMATHIVFAVDSSVVSSKMVSKFINKFDLTEKEIKLLTVYEIPDYLFLEGNIDENWMIDVDIKQEKAAILLLKSLENIFNDAGLKVADKIILKGNPAKEIINYTTDNPVDLLVCGTRDRKYLSKFLLSSVSKRVLEASMSDVLIIR